jgi:YfiH family protein
MEGWFAGFTTLRARGTLGPVLALLGGRSFPVFRPTQVHGNRILTIDDSGEADTLREEADGLATRRRGIVLAVAAADCVPLILFDPRIQVGAVVHSGWRGTLAGIARGAVDLLRTEWGSRPDDLLALIGPGIGACCYQVGPDVIRAFGDARLLTDENVRVVGPATCLDLPGVNRHILREAGVAARNILMSGLCTRCRGDLFPSYRREGKAAGRLLGFLGSFPGPLTASERGT